MSLTIIWCFFYFSLLVILRRECATVIKPDIQRPGWKTPTYLLRDPPVIPSTKNTELFTDSNRSAPPPYPGHKKRRFFCQFLIVPSVPSRITDQRFVVENLAEIPWLDCLKPSLITFQSSKIQYSRRFGIQKVVGTHRRPFRRASFIHSSILPTASLPTETLQSSPSSLFWRSSSSS